MGWLRGRGLPHPGGSDRASWRFLEEVRVAVREQRAALPVAGRLAAVHRVVLVAILVIGVLGGVAVWGAVDRLDEAWARHAVVQGEMADLEAVIGARLDETVGVTGLNSGWSTDDTEVRAQLDDLLAWAGVADGGDLGEEVTGSEAELIEAAEVSGAVDERLLYRLESALRELDGATVRPAADDAQAAHDSARRTVVVVLVPVAGLGCAAAWLGRIHRTQNPPPGEGAPRRA
jgi:hypothetical protein